MTELLGTRLNRYEIRERIGKGGMASVYKAWDTNLERWVAVKVLHAHLADDADFKTRFEREAKLIAKLNHPNIVQVYDFDAVERDGELIYYMVMPYIEGETLRQRMEARRANGEASALLRSLRSCAACAPRSATRTSKAWCIGMSRRATSSSAARGSPS